MKPLTSLLFAVAFVSEVLSAHGQTQVIAPDTSDDKKVVIVFRFSGKLLEEAINRPVTQTTPFNKCIDGNRVIGTSKTDGYVSTDFAAANIDEPLRISFTGKSCSRQKAYTGKFVAESVSETRFDVHFGLDFDGTQFVATEPTANAKVRTTLRDIQPVRRRLGWKVIRPVAMRVGGRKMPEQDAKGARRAEQQITDTIKQKIKPAIAELNEMMAIEKTIVDLEAQFNYEDTVTKTDRYLQVRVAPVGQSQPSPPAAEMLGSAPVEIWIYPRSKELDLTAVLVEWEKARVFLGALNLDLPAVPYQDKLKLKPQGDWEVLQVIPKASVR